MTHNWERSRRGSIDWNRVLRKMNKNFDRMKLAASASRWKGRQSRLESLREQQTIHHQNIDSALNRVTGYLSVSKRSELLADEYSLTAFDAFYMMLDRYDQTTREARTDLDRVGDRPDFDAIVADFQMTWRHLCPIILNRCLRTQCMRARFHTRSFAMTAF